MNRVIKFRGKRLTDGEFHYGSLLQEECGRMCIYDNIRGIREVNPNTVGQFTEMYDMKGKEIYEGDIINWLVGRNGKGFVEEGHVEWRKDEGCYIVINRFTTKDNREIILPLIRCTRDIKVVSNIYDNPEFLKGGTPCEE